MRTKGKLRLDGLLSFAPGSTQFELKGAKRTDRTQRARRVEPDRGVGGIAGHSTGSCSRRPRWRRPNRVASVRRRCYGAGTHSHSLVSALANHPDSIVACERPGASTALRRLGPAKLAGWLEEYRLVDLWRMGDLGANP